MPGTGQVTLRGNYYYGVWWTMRGQTRELPNKASRHRWMRSTEYSVLAARHSAGHRGSHSSQPESGGLVCIR